MIERQSQGNGERQESPRSPTCNGSSWRSEGGAEDNKVGMRGDVPIKALLDGLEDQIDSILGTFKVIKRTVKKDT